MIQSRITQTEWFCYVDMFKTAYLTANKVKSLYLRT